MALDKHVISSVLCVWVSALSLALACFLAVSPEAAFAGQTSAAQGAASNSLTVSSSSLSTAATAKPGKYLQNNGVFSISSSLARTGSYMVDVSGASTAVGANVHLYASNNTLAQVWRASYRGNGVYRFVGYTGGHLLGVSSLKAGASAKALDKGYVDWIVLKNSDGTFSLAPAKAKNLRLAVAGGKAKNSADMRLEKASSSKAQKFSFRKLTGATGALSVGKSVSPGLIEMIPRSKTSSRVDVSGQSRANGANVCLAANNGTRFTKKWRLSYVGYGLYEIKNEYSGKYLAVDGASGKAGSNVSQRNRAKTLAQYWYLQPMGSGVYQIRSALSGAALEFVGSNANVRVNTASKAAAQKFSIKKAQLIDDGTYVLTSAVAGMMALDVSGASKADGANVQIWRSNGTGAQKFKITYVGGGAYRIANAVTGKSVEVAGASQADCANVQMRRSDNSLRQRWIPEYVSGGVRFKSVVSGKYLDVRGAGMSSGTNVWQYTKNGTKAQTWVLHNASWTYYGANATAANAKIMRKAETYEGWRYQWGGRSPSTSFDCAGLVMYCSNVVWGTAFDLEYTNAARLYAKCKKISAKEARIGDLVFYRGTYGNDANYISHVVFYAGGGLMYGAGDPIGYGVVNSIYNILGQPAQVLYARIVH